MKKVFFLLQFLIALNASCQNCNLAWAKQMESLSGNVEGHKIVLDGFGNVYIAGAFNGTLDLDPGAGTFYVVAQNWVNLFLLKLDAAGNFISGANISEGTYTATCTGLEVDQLGNIIVAGVFHGNGDFDPGIGVASLNANGGSDMFIAKFNSSGQLIWNKQFGGNGDDFLNSITINSTNDIYIAGGFADSVDFDPGPGAIYLASQGLSDAFICKLTPVGSHVWVRQFKGVAEQQIWKLESDAMGNQCFLGFFHNTIDFNTSINSQTMTSFGSQDIFVGKLDPTGNFLFAKQIGGTDWDSPKAIAIDQQSNLVLTGNFWSNDLDFDASSATYSLASYPNQTSGFVCKLTNQGDFIWAKGFIGSGDVRSQEVQLDSADNIYSLGHFAGACDFDPSNSVFQLNSTMFGTFLTKLDSSGQFVFTKQFGENGAVYPYDLKADHGNIYLTGWFSGDNDFDPNLTIDTLKNGQTSNVFLVKLSSCQSQPLIDLTPFSHLNICDQTSTSFNVSGNGTIWWSPATLVSSVYPGGSIFFTPTLTVGNYVYYAQTDASCPSLPLLITVTVNAIPTVSIIGTDHICFGSTATLSSIGASTYTWNGSLITNSIVVSPTDTTIYWVKGEDSNFCSDNDTLVLNVNPLPILLTGTTHSILCSGETTTITVTGAQNYYWSNNEHNDKIIVSPGTTSSYTVTGYDVQGCSSQATITQIVDQCSGIQSIESLIRFEFYPNPVENILFLKGNQLIEKSEVEIFDFRGQLIIRMPLTVETSISFENYAKGVYFIRLVKDGQCSLKRSIVKQ